MSVLSNVEEFLQRQGEIYDKFRANRPELVHEGTKPDSALSTQQGGFIIHYKHTPLIRKYVAAAAQCIADIVPCVPYTEDMVHTTLCTVDAKAGRVVDLENVKDKEICTRIQSATNIPIAWFKRVPAPQFEYTGFLVNRTTVIACGIPDPAFFIEGRAILLRLEEANLEYTPLWRCHITVARFTEAVTDRNTLERLVETVDGLTPLGISRNCTQQFGSFACTPRSFTLTELG